jgi:hypothetical protein
LLALLLAILKKYCNINISSAPAKGVVRVERSMGSNPIFSATKPGIAKNQAIPGFFRVFRGFNNAIEKIKRLEMVSKVLKNHLLLLA